MNLKLHGRLHTKPELSAKLKMEPVHFDTAISGGCECEVGRLSAYIGEVGIRFAIPFMRPRRKLPMIASVGGFHIRLKPFHVRARGIGLNVAGTFGTKGAAGEVDAKMAVESNIEAEGKLPKLGRINIDLCEADDLIE